MQNDDIKKMEALYLSAKEAYYNSQPIMLDSEFDELENKLKNVNSRVIYNVGANPTTGIKAKHLSPMLSLEKINFKKEDDDEFINFKNKILSIYKYQIKDILEDESKSLILRFSPKYDGNAINIIYDKNWNLDKVLSRGDGIIGNDITHLLGGLINPKFKNFIENEANGLSYEDIKKFENQAIEIRCEVVINLDTFAEIKNNSKVDIKNARNFVSGLLNSSSKTPNFNMINKLTIQVIEIRIINNNTYNWIYTGMPGSLKITLNKNNINDYIGKLESLKELYFTYFKKHRNIHYLMDGIVCTIEDDEARNKIGFTDHHPKFAFAIKFPPVQKVSKITNITWNMAKNASLVPLIHIDPVDIDGSIISKCSGYNYGYIFGQKTLGIGSQLKMEKGGDIIPNIAKILEYKNETNLKLEVCPFCGHKLQIEDIHAYCTNNECPEIQLVRFTKSLNAFNIPFLGESTIKTFFQTFKNPIDVLCCDDINLKLNSTNKNIEKINKFIKNIKTIYLKDLIYSLGIPNCGESSSKVLAYMWTKNEVDLKGMQKQVIKDFETKYKSILAEYIILLNNRGIDVILDDETEKTQITEDTKTFEMTGSPTPYFKTKNDVVEYLAPFNLIHNKKFDKNTSYLLVDSLTSTTSKIQKAKKLGIQIIEYSQIDTLIKK